MDDNIVYITIHGEKYHKDKNCIFILGKKPREITLEEAIKKKRGPCRACSLRNNNNNNQNNYINKKYNKQNCKNINNYANNQHNNSDIGKNNFINYNEYNMILSELSSQSNINLFKDNNEIIKNNNNIYNNNYINEKKKDLSEEKKELSEDIDFNGNSYNMKNKKNNIKNFIYDSSFSNISDFKKENVNSNFLKNKIFSEEKFYQYQKNGNKISEKIQNLIEKDKHRIKYYNNNNINKDQESEFIKNEKIIYKENDNKIKNIINDNCINNQTSQFRLITSFNSNPLYLNNMQYIFNYLSINNNNGDINSKKNELNFLEETNNNAQILLLKNNSLLNGGNNLNKLKDNEIINQDMIQKGCYKYKLELKSLNEKDKVLVKISVGFEIEYINISDMNIIIDENMIKKENIDLKLGAICENDEIKKNLIIFKSTGVIYVLINIIRGKMFIIGENKLDNINIKNDIFYFKNFNPINIYLFKNIKPVFQCDKALFNNFEVRINDKKIDSK